jgi:hypothetical protein
MLHLGIKNTLRILRGTGVGMFLGDDEGNDGGAMFFTDKNGKHDELPVL